jgi:hypothetical protein
MPPIPAEQTAEVAATVTPKTPFELLSIATKALGADNGNLTSGASLSDLYSALTTMTEMAVPQMTTLKSTFNQSSSPTTGLTAYSLEAGAKVLYPVLTPLRNMIPRVGGGEGTQANWKAITGINTTNMSAGVSEGNRGGVISVTTADYLAAFKGIGFESSASMEAQYAGQGFDDIKARAAKVGLQSLMIAEEKMIISGNGSLALGTTPTPSLSASTTGGTLPTSTQSVICVALTASGYARNTLAAGLVPSYNRTNADSSSDTINGGTAQKSAAATVGVTGATGSVTATVAAVRGAAAYAWYWGVAGSELLGAITTVPVILIKTTATGTQNASAMPSTDNSTNGLDYDGIITQVLKSGSGGYWKDLGGATLTGNGSGGIVEFDTFLQNQWDVWRLNPDTIWVSSQQAGNISSKILTGGVNSSLRFNISAEQGALGGGIVASGYRNTFGLDGATMLNIKQHPYLTPGTILFTQGELPYPMADINNIWQIKTRQEYYQIEWPLRTRRYEYGVYADEVLQGYAPFSCGVITGVGVG